MPHPDLRAGSKVSPEQGDRYLLAEGEGTQLPSGLGWRVSSRKRRPQAP